MEERKNKFDLDTSMEYLKYIREHKYYLHNERVVLDFCCDVMFTVKETMNGIKEIDILKNNLEKDNVDLIRQLYKFVTGEDVSPIRVLEALISRVKILIKYEEDPRDFIISITALSAINGYLRKPGVFEQLVKLHESEEEGETSLHAYLYSTIFSILKALVEYDLNDFQNISHFFKLELKRLLLVMILQSKMTGKGSMHSVAYDNFIQNISSLCYTNGLHDTDKFYKMTSLIGVIDN